MTDMDKGELKEKIDKMFDKLRTDLFRAEIYEDRVLSEIAYNIMNRCENNCLYCPCFGAECEGELEYIEDCEEMVQNWMKSIVLKIDWDY